MYMTPSSTLRWNPECQIWERWHWLIPFNSDGYWMPHPGGPRLSSHLPARIVSYEDTFCQPSLHHFYLPKP